MKEKVKVMKEREQIKGVLFYLLIYIEHFIRGLFKVLACHSNLLGAY